MKNLFDLWTNLTQPQAMVLNTILTAVIIPIVIFFWQRTIISRLREETAAAQAQSLKAEADVADLAAEQGIDGAAAPAEDNWKYLRDDWLKIRNELIDIATNPEIDGRTRAAYRRIDKRAGYDGLIRKLGEDGNLEGRRADFEHASSIWNPFRTNRRGVPDTAVAEMRGLVQKLGLS